MINDNPLKTLQELTPLLQDLSYKFMPQTLLVEANDGVCVVHGLTILPGETSVAVCEVTGNTELRRRSHGEHEYLIVLSGFINVVYLDGTTASVSQYESHHITPGTKGYSISGDGARVLIVTVSTNA